jgi:hypothetical protein
MARAYSMHLNRVHRWLAEQSNFAVLRVPYAELVADPATVTARVNEFLGGRLDVAAASRAVDPALYRNRKN